MNIRKQDVKPWVGKQITAVKKDGSVVSGKLVRIQGERLMIQRSKGKKATTKAIIPLVLFDLLAIGTSPFAYGYPGYAPYAYGGAPYAYGGFGPYGYGGPGYPGYYW